MHTCVIIRLIYLSYNILLSSTSTEITSQLFGDNTEVLPAAFGDFNSDELTDLFVLRNRSQIVEILLGSNDLTPQLTAAGNLKCFFEKCRITSVVPGDFNGDALMDVVVTTKCPEAGVKELHVHVLWGSLDKLNCSFDEKKPILRMHGEPLALDNNNDFVIDLFGINMDGKRGIWYFNPKSPPVFHPLDPDNEDNTYKMRDPHSNAYLDLNNDNIADLLLTVDNEAYQFEEWRGRRKEAKFSFYKKIAAPQYARRKLGQSLFLDMELKGKLDHLVPVIDRKNPRILVLSNNHWMNLNVKFNYLDKSWHFLETGLPFSKAVTLRGGDYNMDGYPDVLGTLTSGGINRTFLFENVPCQSGCDNFTRTFQIQWNGFSHNINDSVGGIFYDIYQNGILDVVLIRLFPNGSHYVSAIKNNLDYDANFIKVMVLTGLTNKNVSLPNSRLSSHRNKFGTNLPGPRISYRTFDQEGFVRTGVSAQLPQSAHYSLNLPYIMFALGRTPNFVDNITVGFAAEHRDLLQVIPNSQMVLIPVQIDNPSGWKVQLFVTPSKIIFLSAMTLVGVCIVIVLVIAFLYWKEKKMDRLERLQEAHRFNFDAILLSVHFKRSQLSTE